MAWHKKWRVVFSVLIVLILLVIIIAIAGIYFLFVSVDDKLLIEEIEKFVEIPSNHKRTIDYKSKWDFSETSFHNPRIYYVWIVNDKRDSERRWVYRVSSEYYKLTKEKPRVLTPSTVKDIYIEIFPYPEQLSKEQTVFNEENIWTLSLPRLGHPQAEYFDAENDDDAIFLVEQLTNIRNPNLSHVNDLIYRSSVHNVYVINGTNFNTNVNAAYGIISINLPN